MDERSDDPAPAGCIEGTVREMSLTIRTRPYVSLALAAAAGFVLGGKLLGQLVRGILRMALPTAVDVVVGIIRGGGSTAEDPRRREQ